MHKIFDSVHLNTVMLYLLTILFINVTPVTMQSFAVHVEDLERSLTEFADRFIRTIDPTIDKFGNLTIRIISVLENRTKTNTSEILYWLETNLFVLLFATVIFFIFVLILLTLLDNLLFKYKILPESRRSIGLWIITIIFIWLFIAVVSSTWLPASKTNLKTLQYVLVGLLGSVLIYLLFIWICFIYTRRTQIQDHFTQLWNHNMHNRTSEKRRSMIATNDIESAHT